MNVVVYARYSCNGQREESIEGQLKECRKYAKENDLTIINEYIDEALSGRSDDRPEFNRMIADSDKHEFQAILVYTIDRFGRDMKKSIHHEIQLNKNNVILLSATENFGDNASGRLYRNIMMSYAQFFSEELSQKVLRGLLLNAEKGIFNGGIPALGYKVINQEFVIDEETAPFVRKIFQMYSNGETCANIIDYLNNHGVKTARGSKFTRNSLHTILNNRKYIGEYRYGNIVITDCVPRIIDDDLFNQVATILEKNKHNAGHNKANVEYLLTTKLFCGHCKSAMVGISGKSHTGTIYNYYSCNNARKKNCKKKNVRKELIENLVIKKCREILTDKNIIKIAKKVSSISKRDKDTTALKQIKNQLKQNEKQQDTLLNSLSFCNNEKTAQKVYAKMDELETLHSQLEKDLSIEELKNITFTEDEIKFFLTQLKNGDINDIKHKKLLINMFVNSIYLYDDRLTIVFNIGNESITVDDILLSEIESDNDYIKGLYTTSSGVPHIKILETVDITWFQGFFVISTWIKLWIFYDHLSYLNDHLTVLILYLEFILYYLL